MSFGLRLSKLWAAVRSPVARRALFGHGVLAASEHWPVLRLPLATIVDIGANRGQFALAARSYSKTVSVYSFEPLQAPAEKFRRIFGTDPKVQLFVCAIGESSGCTTMHLSARDDSSSLLEITETQLALFPGTHAAGTVEIEVATLRSKLRAEVIVDPAMLKLDVQGYELAALRGCGDLLPAFQYVYCESSFVELYRGQALVHEVISFLAGRGFALVGLFNLVHDSRGDAVQGDFLFQQRSALPAV